MKLLVSVRDLAGFVDPEKSILDAFAVRIIRWFVNADGDGKGVLLSIIA